MDRTHRSGRGSSSMGGVIIERSRGNLRWNVQRDPPHLHATAAIGLLLLLLLQWTCSSCQGASLFFSWSILLGFFRDSFGILWVIALVTTIVQGWPLCFIQTCWILYGFLELILAADNRGRSSHPRHCPRYKAHSEYLPFICLHFRAESISDLPKFMKESGQSFSFCSHQQLPSIIFRLCYWYCCCWYSDPTPKYGHYPPPFNFSCLIPNLFRYCLHSREIQSKSSAIFNEINLYSYGILLGRDFK